MANAFACRSEAVPVWRMRLLGNRALLAAVGIEMALVLGLVGIPGLNTLLGGTLPTALGWWFPLVGAVAVVLADAAQKAGVSRSRARARDRAPLVPPAR